MSNNGSVTGWLAALRNGDSIAAQRCWEGYFDRLVRLARAKLAAKRRTLQDPEDIALSALKSFCLAAERGRFPKLDDRHDLWQILVMLTAQDHQCLASGERLPAVGAAARSARRNLGLDPRIDGRRTDARPHC